jgi:hypothetical protein
MAHDADIHRNTLAGHAAKAKGFDSWQVRKPPRPRIRARMAEKGQ